MYIFLLINEVMYDEDDLDEYQDKSDIDTKSDIIDTILKEYEKKELSNEDIKDIINLNTVLL